MIRPALQRLILQANFHARNFEQVVWLVGDGRSGTTWVSRLLNPDQRMRELFEPFHPRFIEEMRLLGYNHYVRPGTEWPELMDVCHRVFSGRLIHPRVDQKNWGTWYNGLLVKDIFANLLAKWAYDNFGHAKIVLLMRNPMDIAVSKSRLMDWEWHIEPDALWGQDELRDDFLYPYETLFHDVRDSDDYIQKAVLTWCVLNAVPLQQFPEGAISITQYESIRNDPQREVDAILDFAGRPRVVLTQDAIQRPSRTSARDKGQTGTWKDALDATTIDRCLKIIEAFGMDRFYPDL